MFKNYVLVMIRNLRRNTIYATINILGLAIGLACCIDIGFFIHREMCFDFMHTELDKIYRVLRETGDTDNRRFTDLVLLHGSSIRNPAGNFKVVRLMNRTTLSCYILCR